MSLVIPSNLRGNFTILDSGHPRDEWAIDRKIPKNEKYNVHVEEANSVVSVTYQPPVEEIGKFPILLSPGFTAGEYSFDLLQKALAELNYPSLSLSHHRNHDSKYTIQETHTFGDKAVMKDANNRYGYTRFIVVGWSMGGGDVAHLAHDSNLCAHDMIEEVHFVNPMGQGENNNVRDVSKRMVGALAVDFKLAMGLPLRQKLLLVRAAMDSSKRAVTNINQTWLEAHYASSVDARVMIRALAVNGMNIVQIVSENDTVFTPNDLLRSTADIDFNRRVLITGEFARHIAPLLVPRTLARSIGGLSLAA